MYTMGPREISVIIDHLRHADRVAAALDIPKTAGLNDIQWSINQVLNYILRAAISPIQIEQQPRADAIFAPILPEGAP